MNIYMQFRLIFVAKWLVNIYKHRLIPVFSYEEFSFPEYV
jgi:hypothetical protein